MSRWSRRRVLLAAAAALPAGALPTTALAGAAEAAVRPPAGAGSDSPPALPGAPVARVAPVVDPATEIGGAATGAVRTAAPDVAAGALAGPAAPAPTAPAPTASTPAASARAPLPAYREAPFTITQLPPGGRPYAQASPPPLHDRGVHDAGGVRMSLRGGVLYDHPVGQAQYGISLHEGHRLTGDKTYLDRAVAQARRLVDRRVTRGNAWFYPYRFPFRLHGSAETLAPPWFSMMAQGQALSLFVRLASTTRDPRWREAADRTFASFLLPYAAGRPWGVYVEDGLLRLEEYPDPHRAWGDRTYNGHVFAAFGLYDHAGLTGDATAASLLRGAITTARDLVPRIRVPGWRSHYCLRHLHDAGHYHQIHVDQQRQLLAITGDEAFARTADGLYDDFPPAALGGTPGGGSVAFAAGRHPAYRFAPDGAVVAARTFVTTRPTSAAAADRTRIPGRPGLWYAMTTGALAGWSVQEAPPRRLLRGLHAVLGYPVAQLARVRTARPLAVTAGASGATNPVPTRYTAGEGVLVDARGVLDGAGHVRLAAGPYAGRWVRADAVPLVGSRPQTVVAVPRPGR